MRTKNLLLIILLIVVISAVVFYLNDKNLLLSSIGNDPCPKPKGMDCPTGSVSSSTTINVGSDSGLAQKTANNINSLQSYRKVLDYLIKQGYTNTATTLQGYANTACYSYLASTTCGSLACPPPPSCVSSGSIRFRSTSVSDSPENTCTASVSTGTNGVFIVTITCTTSCSGTASVFCEEEESRSAS